MIESPSVGPVIRVIYGQVEKDAVYIFEAKHSFQEPLEKGQEGALEASKLSDQGSNDTPKPSEVQAQEKSSPMPVSESSSGKSMLLTSFLLRPEDLRLCTSTPRFRGFLQLLKALKPTAVQLKGDSEEVQCREKVIVAIQKTIGVTASYSETMDIVGLKIEVGVENPRPLSRVPPKEALGAEEQWVSMTYHSLEEVISNTKIMIGEVAITPNPEGFFVLELPEMQEVKVQVRVKGKKPLEVKTFPILMGSEPSVVPKSQRYRARSALFSKPSLQIYLSRTPLLSKKVSLDGGVGGGVGYGREVPGEKKGERFATLIGVESRDIWDRFGFRASILYTQARDSVLPRTITARGLGVYDFSFFEDSLILRLGLGFELFDAKVKLKKKIVVSGAEDPAALIPERVNSPIASFSVMSSPWKNLTLAVHQLITPLYIPNVGYYPSASSSFEAGWKFKNQFSFNFTLGSEEHRFPSIRGETRLHLDYGLLTLKTGLF